jgi:hypothetical protein
MFHGRRPQCRLEQDQGGKGGLMVPILLWLLGVPGLLIILLLVLGVLHF